jgi:hypothetical protein
MKTYVVSGDPSKSFLYEILAPKKPSCSSHMPMGSTLDANDVQLVADWIAGGARR